MTNVTTIVPKDVQARFEQLAAHRLSKLSAQQMIDMAVETGVPFDASIAHYQLQLDLIDALDRFRHSRNEPEALLLCKGALASAQAMSWLASNYPFSDIDEARYAAASCFELFGENMTVVLSPEAFTSPDPTTDVRSGALN